MQGPGSTPEWKSNLRNILKRTEDNLESRRIFLHQSSSPKSSQQATLSTPTFPTIPSAYDIPYTKSSLISSRVDQWKSQDDGEVELLKDQISELKKQNEELTVQLTQLSVKLNSRSDSYEDDFYSKHSKWKREEAFEKEQLLDDVKKEVELVIQSNLLEYQKEVLSLLTQQMQQILQPLHQQMQQHLSQMDKMESHHDKLREQIQSTNQPLLQTIQQQATLSHSVKFCETEVKEHRKVLENSTVQIQHLQQELQTKFASVENQQLQLRHQIERTQDTIQKQSSLHQTIEELKRALEDLKSNQSHSDSIRKEVSWLKEEQERTKTTLHSTIEDLKKSLTTSWQQDKEWTKQQNQMNLESMKNEISSLRTQQNQMIPLLQSTSAQQQTPQPVLEVPDLTELKSSVTNLQLQGTQLEWKVKEVTASSKMETDNLRDQISQYLQHLQKVNSDMLQQREEIQKANQMEFSSIRQDLLDNKLQLGVLKKEVESTVQTSSSLIEDNKRLNSEVVALKMEQGMLQQEVKLRLDSFQHLVNAHEASLQRLSTGLASLQAVPTTIQTQVRPSPHSESPRFIPTQETPRVVDKTDLDERVTNLFNLQQELFDTEKAIRDKLVTISAKGNQTQPAAPVSRPTTAKESIPRIVVEPPAKSPPLSPQQKNKEPVVDPSKVKRKIDFVQALDLSKLQQRLQEEKKKEVEVQEEQLKEEFSPQDASEQEEEPVEEEEVEEQFDEEPVEEQEEEAENFEDMEGEESSLDDSLHFSDDDNQLPIDEEDLPAASPRISLSDLLAMNS